MNGTLLTVLGAATSAGGIGVFGLWWLHAGARRRQNLPLTGTVLLSLGVLALVTGWVLADRTIGQPVGRGEALKTGGLAAASVVALYALWLNDRRRRVEESRQEIESRRQKLEYQRAEHDRERVADERFARAVELLGNDADQVRVGALHALAGLARSRPAYTQTVLDVLCSYLRRPFDHPRYAERRDEAMGKRGDEGTREPFDTPEKRQSADRWLQVRMTAQRLIADLLPPVSEPDAHPYDLDLHGATLEYFDISEKVVGQIRARETNLYESTSLWGTQVHGPAWFTGARCWGRLHAQEMVFHNRSWFSKFEARGVIDLERTEFRGDTKFANARFHDQVSFHDAVFAENIDFTGATFDHTLAQQDLPPGWQIHPTVDNSFSLVRGLA
jgi:hypothetical protein